jgi:hypothetical protein
VVCTYVGFATYRHATVKIHLYFKGLMFMKCFVLKKEKKKKKKKKKKGDKNRALRKDSNKK